MLDVLELAVQFDQLFMYYHIIPSIIISYFIIIVEMIV